MKRTDRKSDCAINFSLESIGDPWSLLIVRDVVFFGKRTFGDFANSDERIGTSTLAQRLKSLEEKGVLKRLSSPSDRRSESYHLTEKGLDLLPIVFELMAWGAAYDPETGANKRLVAEYATDRQGVLDRARKVVRNGGSIVDHIPEIFIPGNRPKGKSVPMS